MLLNIVVLIALAITAEVLLKLNQRHYGWHISDFYARHSQLHVLWTVVPGELAVVTGFEFDSSHSV
jgi:hypothetical protein